MMRSGSGHFECGNPLTDIAFDMSLPTCGTGLFFQDTAPSQLVHSTSSLRIGASCNLIDTNPCKKERENPGSGSCHLECGNPLTDVTFDVSLPTCGTGLIFQDTVPSQSVHSMSSQSLQERERNLDPDPVISNTATH